MSTDIVTWQPPAEKTVRRALTGLGWAVFAALVGGIIFVVGPTVAMILGIVAWIFQNLITMAISGAVLLAVLTLIRDIFSNEGRLNKFFKLRYAQAVNWLVWDALNSDPMTPFHEKKASLAKDRVIFTDALAAFEGIIRRFLESADKYRKDAAKAESAAKAAQRQGISTAFELKSHEWGRFNDTAADFEARAAKLAPIRDDLRKVVGVIDSIVQKLDIEIRVTKDMWDASTAMSDLNKKARNIMGFGERYELAQQAAMIVETKYADELGRLDNLKAIAGPLIDSIDVERGAYSEELMQKWGQSAMPMELIATVPAGLIAAPTAEDRPLKSLI